MKLDHLVLLVGSLEESLPYYETLLPLLGFTKVRDHVFGNSDEVYIDFKQAADLEPGYRRYAIGLNHLGFTALSDEAVERVATQMAAAGYEVPERQRIGNAYSLFMKDRDGMRFEVSHYSP